MTKIGGSAQDVTNVSVLNFILKVDDVISYLYLIFTDIMNEIVQYACSKKRISFFEEIGSVRTTQYTAQAKGLGGQVQFGQTRVTQSPI